MLFSVRFVLGIVAAAVTVMAEVGNDPSQNIAWWFDQSGWHQTADWIRLHGPHLIGPLFVPMLLAICAICLLWPLFSFLSRFFFRRSRSETEVPDMPLKKAFDYIVNDSRATLKRAGMPAVVDYGPATGMLVLQQGVEHQDARLRLQEKLISGDLSSWGKRETMPPSWLPHFEAVIRTIPTDYWNLAHLDPLYCFGNDGTVPETQFTDIHQKEVPNYAALQLSKKQVMRIWRRKSYLARWKAHIAKKKRITYWRSFDV